MPRLPLGEVSGQLGTCLRGASVAVRVAIDAGEQCLEPALVPAVVAAERAQPSQRLRHRAPAATACHSSDAVPLRGRAPDGEHGEAELLHYAVSTTQEVEQTLDVRRIVELDAYLPQLDLPRIGPGTVPCPSECEGCHN